MVFQLCESIWFQFVMCMLLWKWFNFLSTSLVVQFIGSIQLVNFTSRNLHLGGQYKLDFSNKLQMKFLATFLSLFINGVLGASKVWATMGSTPLEVQVQVPSRHLRFNLGGLMNKRNVFYSDQNLEDRSDKNWDKFIMSHSL
jgi:hypothetical protein